MENLVLKKTVVLLLRCEILFQSLNLNSQLISPRRQVEAGGRRNNMFGPMWRFSFGKSPKIMISLKIFDEKGCKVGFFYRDIPAEMEVKRMLYLTELVVEYRAYMKKGHSNNFEFELSQFDKNRPLLYASSFTALFEKFHCDGADIFCSRLKHDGLLQEVFRLIG